jgi:alpha-D-ribose 1-methylphosphonate 5-triphosphate synthase subunit PhnI
MGYVAAKGGLEAILAAEDLVRRSSLGGSSPHLRLDQISERTRLAVDRIMGEAGLWAPELAARAFRQAEGDMVEAAHLLRAFRTNLPRFALTPVVSADEMVPLRRIVPAYRTPPGPQLLGRTSDYTGRLLDLTPELSAPVPESPEAKPSQVASSASATGAEFSANGNSPAGPKRAPEGGLSRHRRLYELLRDLDLVVDRRRDVAGGDDPEPYDITRLPVRPGVPRSARLAVMARAETGALVNLWYRNVLGTDMHLHEVTLGEVRHGLLPVPVTHPHTGRPVVVGRIRATEAEAIEDLSGEGRDSSRFDVGYGICVGHNERKAIAMANLDIAVVMTEGKGPLEQTVLMTTDVLDSSGFLEHLKLPHYVTFRSMVERKLAVREAAGRKASEAGTAQTGKVSGAKRVGQPV